MATKQKYGLYMPETKTLMYIETTKQEFERFLREQQFQLKMEQKTPETEYDDFDHIIEEVKKAPYNTMSLDLMKIL